MLSDLFDTRVGRTHFVKSSAAWDELVHQASETVVLPALLRQIRSFGELSSIPAPICELLTASEDLNAERNDVILSEAAHVASLLNEIGIQPLALKGVAYLIAGVYPNQAARYLGDIDLLLPAAALSLAASHLYAHSFFENESDKFIHFRHHHPAIRRNGLPPIELHHRLGQGVCDRLLPAAAILDHATPITYQGASFLIPSPTHLVIHLILHSQLAHPYHNRIFPPLRTLFDLQHIQACFTDQIEWPAIVETFRAHGESATLLLHLKQARHTLGIETPATPADLPWVLNLRWRRRLLLNRYPKLRFFDPIYLLMSLFSRRLRLVFPILRAVFSV